MIKHKDIRAFKCRYHRNGIMGEGFFVCRFRFIRGRDSQLMQAIVFDGKGQVAVTSDDMNEGWRGDNFEDVLRDSIKIACENRRDEVFGALPMSATG